MVTEILETGIVNGDTHRRAAQAGANWIWSQTERRSLIAQLSYLDVSYYGLSRSLLPGYRYPSASVGEQFSFSERATLTLSAFGSRLQSQTQGNSSHEEGLQAEVMYFLSEQTKVDASLGKSRRVLSGTGSQGTDAFASLAHSLLLGSLSLSYKRSLVPYGFGFLAQQEQFVGTWTRSLTPYLDSSLSFYRIQNNETTVLLRLDRRNYNSVSVALNWRPAETWSVGARIDCIRTLTPDLQGLPVHEWRSSVGLTWTPRPTSRSW